MQINIFLRVMRRREDGFHDLASLFHVIDLGDSMKFVIRDGASEDTLTCEMEGVPTDSSNLVIKASFCARTCLQSELDKCMRLAADEFIFLPRLFAK